MRCSCVLRGGLEVLTFRAARLQLDCVSSAVVGNAKNEAFFTLHDGAEADARGTHLLFVFAS